MTVSAVSVPDGQGTPGDTPLCVSAQDLVVGQLLAEGGEGKVFEVRTAPVLRDGILGTGAAFVYKELRQQREVLELAPTVSFLTALEAMEPGLAARVRASSAWPVALVVGEAPGVAVGCLMPRAPGCFWLRHRDGGPRLATLSYLASDPDRMAFAYGTVVPPPGAPPRVAVVYALARLLEAWQGTGVGSDALQGSVPRDGLGRAVHGDLSAKNVLWSLDPVPAVYVLDCDGATVATASPSAPARMQAWGRVARATTPNWDDPAVAPGVAPGLPSDRYLLGLAFLRVVGAAHFPLQARQRGGGKLNVDLELPHSWRRLPDMPRLWGLCERSLSVVDIDGRPTPSEWAAGLEELLQEMGSADLAARVRASQGDQRPSLGGGQFGDERGRSSPALVTVPDVEVRPVLRRRKLSAWGLVGPAPGVQGQLGAGGATLAGHGRPRPGPGSVAVGTGLAGLGVGNPGLRQFVGRCAEAWGAAHRLALRLMLSRGRRVDGFRRFIWVLVLDLVAACVLLFLVGEIVSPWIGL